VIGSLRAASSSRSPQPWSSADGYRAGPRRRIRLWTRKAPGLLAMAHG
jgi:hypothetical protein